MVILYTMVAMLAVNIMLCVWATLSFREQKFDYLWPLVVGGGAGGRVAGGGRGGRPCDPAPLSRNLQKRGMYAVSVGFFCGGREEAGDWGQQSAPPAGLCRWLASASSYSCAADLPLGVRGGMWL